MSNRKELLNKIRMNSSELTVVTFYFDLNTRQVGRSKSPANKKYLTLGTHLLDLKVNLFVLGDPEIMVEVWRERCFRGLANHTFCYPITLESLPAYRYRPKIEKAFAAGRRPIGLNHMKDTPLYFILGWSKLWAIRKAIQLNPFNSEKFAWLDYGLFHLWSGAERIKKSTLLDNLTKLESDRIQLTIIKELDLTEIADRIEFYKRHQYLLVSGYFGGGISVMKWLAKQFKSELKSCLKSGYPNLEESILAVIYTQQKDKFNPFYGNYIDLISTHLPGIGNLPILVNNVRHSRTLEMWPPTINIYKQVIRFLDDKSTKINGSDKIPTSKDILQLLVIYDEALIAGWYLKDFIISKQAASKIVATINAHPECHSQINFSHYNHNLSFHQMKVNPKTN